MAVEALELSPQHLLFGLSKGGYDRPVTPTYATNADPVIPPIPWETQGYRFE